MPEDNSPQMDGFQLLGITCQDNTSTFTQDSFSFSIYSALEPCEIVSNSNSNYPGGE